ncbi:MAG: hypothetical protein KDD40_10595, partial [Bdellovibrionales bacterium]|nr:hypothetical protein [Bdellovibrionales bacterium]
KDFFPEAKAAIASNPIVAQLFSNCENSYFSCLPERETELLQQLPLSSLHNLEGLVAWSSQQEIEDIITFFRVLGFQKLGDIRNFELHSFQQRWGKTGEQMWKRLHGYDKQVITPLKNDFNYVDHVDLYMPISLRPFLLHQLENHTRKLINTIKDHHKEMNRLVIYLHCEYNYDVHVIEIVPQYDHLNLLYIYEELDKKLHHIDLSNPIKKFDIEAFTCKAKHSKFLPWQQQSLKRKQLSKNAIDRGNNVLSGFLPTQIDFDNFNCSENLHYSLEGDTTEDLRINGHKYQLDWLNTTTQEPALELEEHYSLPLEIEDISKYQKVTTLSSNLFNFDRNANDRGQHYYLAIDSDHNKVCICYDQIEQKYFKVGHF